MSEYKQHETRNAVSLDEYMSGMPWRASTEDIGEALRQRKEEQSKNRFILRLLDPDLSGGYDRLVEIVAKDEMPPSDEKGEFFIWLRPVAEDALGKLESHKMGSDDLIYDNEGSLDDNGYFVDAAGVDEDEFRNVARVPLKKPEEEVPEVLYAQPPTQEEQDRYYG